MTVFFNTLLSHTTTSYLLDKIAEYFQTNPGCIAENYDAQQAQERNLRDLEKYCANPHVWFEETTMHESYASPGSQTTFQRTFFLHDFEVLKKHGYADDDGIYVLLEEDGSGFPAKVKINIECH